MVAWRFPGFPIYMETMQSSGKVECACWRFWKFLLTIHNSCYNKHSNRAGGRIYNIINNIFLNCQNSNTYMNWQKSDTHSNFNVLLLWNGCIWNYNIYHSHKNGTYSGNTGRTGRLSCLCWEPLDSRTQYSSKGKKCKQILSERGNFNCFWYFPFLYCIQNFS